ncbi:type II toxin-antitoxin system VapC family toxin [Candidatus Woesearchaeota archaeon]|nr:type II toxin-antitoxin system VapC family toxin [Candidatus Woesearchaeota archaeon]
MIKVLDTTFLVDLIRGKEETRALWGKKDDLLTTQMNMYEVIRGFFMKGMPPEKFVRAMELFENIRVLPLNDPSIIKAAEISARLKKEGNTVADADCLAAGIALAHGITTIVTRNTEHFKRMKGLIVESY